MTTESEREHGTQCPFCFQTATVQGYWIGERFTPLACLCGAEWVSQSPQANYTRDRLKGAQGD